MLRDVINTIESIWQTTVAPPGISSVAATTGATGTVAVDSSSIAFGTYNVLLKIINPGLPGVATAQLSLDNGNNVGNPNSQGNMSPTFTLPSALYSVPLPPLSGSNLSPGGLLSPGLSGLVLSFSGTFRAGDIYTFTAIPTVTFLFGNEHIASQDILYPRVIWLPVGHSFTGGEDFASGADQRTQPRALRMDVSHLVAKCWGVDYDRTELLRDTCINAIHLSAVAAAKTMRGDWGARTHQVNQLGREFNLYVDVKRPVLLLPPAQDSQVVQPVFTPFETMEIDHLDGTVGTVSRG